MRTRCLYYYYQCLFLARERNHFNDEVEGWLAQSVPSHYRLI